MTIGAGRQANSTKPVIASMIAHPTYVVEEKGAVEDTCADGVVPLLSHTLWSSLFLSMSRSQSNSTFALHVEMSELNLS